MTEINLKSCPFCGGEAKINIRIEYDHRGLADMFRFVECMDCHAKSTEILMPKYGYRPSVISEDAHKLEDAWNRRE